MRLPLSDLKQVMLDLRYRAFYISGFHVVRVTGLTQSCSFDRRLFLIESTQRSANAFRLGLCWQSERLDAGRPESVLK
jgi:hypothetical protein